MSGTQQAGGLGRRPWMMTALAGLAGSAQGAAPGAGLLAQPREDDWARLPPHPRLLADRAAVARAAVARVAAQDDATTRLLRAMLMDEAQRLAAAPAIQFPAAGIMLPAMREAQRRVLAWGMAWRLTGDADWLARARAELLILARLPGWGPGHFLGVGEAALAVAVGYDWLHDELSEAERAELRRALVGKALLPSFEQTPGHGGWLDGDFNWAQVCHGGLVAGALVLAGHEPALARAVVARALSHLGPVTASYAPDGGHGEGTTYWSYGTLFHVLLVEALRGSFGQAFGLDRAPGFLATADFAVQMRGPGGQDFSYSDYNDERVHEPLMAWFAAERRDAGLMQEELADLARLRERRGVPSRHLPLELLWWRPALPPAAAPRPLRWQAGGVQPLLVLRSAWGDPRASFIAAKGGTAQHSHAHMDVGGFVLEADGQRWAVDPGREIYDRMRAGRIDLWNYAQDSSRWQVFRPGPEAHNILRFDAGLQRVDGQAGITALPDGGGRIELTPVYAGPVTSVQRDIALRPDRSIVLTDRWQVAARPVQVQWQWLTQADVQIGRDALVLRQGGERLVLQLALSGAPGWRAEVQDMSAPRRPFDSPNPGLRRIVLTLRCAAGARVQLRVRAVPGSVA